MQKRRGVFVLLFLTLLVAAGCVGKTPAPLSQIKTAISAISRAERAGALETAAPDLQMAREKLQQAEQAVQRLDYPSAQRLAEQAIADANAAEIKAKTAEARKAASEIKGNMQTLREESERAPSR